MRINSRRKGLTMSKEMVDTKIATADVCSVDRHVLATVRSAFERCVR